MLLWQYSSAQAETKKIEDVVKQGKQTALELRPSVCETSMQASGPVALPVLATVFTISSSRSV